MTQKSFSKIYDFLTNKEYWLYFVFFSFPVLFPKVCSNIFDNYVNDVFFQKIKPSVFTDIIWLVTVLFFAALYITKYSLGNFFSKHRTIALAVISWWYFLARCDSGWNTVALKTFDGIKYPDLIFIILFMNLIFVVTNRRSKVNEELFTTEGKFIPELIDIDEEITGRGKYAQDIAKHVLNSFKKINGFGHESFSIGILGKWGTGKTVFLNQISKVLEKNSNCEVIKFHPWRNHVSSNLISNFFEILNDTLGNKNPSLKKSLRAYSSQLAKLDDNIYVKTIDFLLNLLGGSDSIEKLYNDINSQIEKMNKQFIIMVDDLDRLDGSEMLEVIKLIRSSSNFSNTVFIVAYDKEHVLSQIKQIRNDFELSYLEKIFLAEFELPIFENEDLMAKLSQNIINNLANQSSNIKANLEAYFNSDKNENLIIKHCITSLRDAYRFPNMFMVDYIPVKNEVYFKDFFNLELIKYKYFSLYNFIKINYYSFILVDSYSQYNSIIYVNQGLLSSLLSSANNLPTNSLDLINYLFHNRTKESPGSIVSTVIKKKNYAPREDISASTSLLIRYNIFNYFALRLEKNIISDFAFHEAKVLPFEAYSSKIKEWSVVKIYREQIITKIGMIEEILDKNELLSDTKILFIISENCGDDEINIILDILTQRLEPKMWDLESKTNLLKFIEENKYKSMYLGLLFYKLEFDEGIKNTRLQFIENDQLENHFLDFMNIDESQLSRYDKVRVLKYINNSVLISLILKNNSLMYAMRRYFDFSIKECMELFFPIKNGEYHLSYLQSIFVNLNEIVELLTANSEFSVEEVDKYKLIFTKLKEIKNGLVPYYAVSENSLDFVP